MSYSTAVSDPGVGGIAWAIDTIAGVSFGRVKVAFGIEGAAVDVSASNPLPITAASLPLPSGAATSAKQDSLITLIAGGLPAALAAGGGLKIEGVAGGVAVPVSAASLPLPSGAATEASLAAAAASLSILDDWDETDRAKVNLIVGQAGIAAGAGAVGATVPRVTLASDDPAVALLTLLSALIQTEDAAHLSGHKGIMFLAVRNDTHATLAGTDGDYIPLCVSSAGGLYVEIQNNASVVVASALPAGTNNIGDVDVLTVPTDPFGANADAASATGSISAKLRFIAATGIPVTSCALPTGAATAANQTTIIGHVDGIETLLAGGLPAALGAGGGLKVDGSGTALPVSLASVPSHAVTNAGTFAVQVDGAALTSLQLLDDAIFSDDAAFTPGTSKGLAVGFQADDTATDSVDEGDFGVARMTLDRKVYTVSEADSASIRVSGTACTPKFAIIDAATSGDNTLVSAVASKKIRVLSLFLVSAGTVNARFESGAGGTALTGQMNLIANTGFVLPENRYGWFETASNTLLNLELSAAVSVDGCITYIEV